MKRNVLVLGASANIERFSCQAIQKLLGYGHHVLAIAAKEGIVEGVRFDTEKKLYSDIDTVTLYLSERNQKDYYDYLLQLKPRRVIFNPGTENPELEMLLSKHHIPFIHTCTLILLDSGKF